MRRTPDPGDQSELDGVSCTSAAFCIAVGQYDIFRSDQELPLALRWKGTHWSMQKARSPADLGRQWALNGVSCVSRTACTAVGDYENGTLAERWDGRRWSIQKPPNPGKGEGYDELTAVSCPSKTVCTAVGAADFNHAFVERWTARSSPAGR
jgi:hypothetical protein